MIAEVFFLMGLLVFFGCLGGVGVVLLAVSISYLIENAMWLLKTLFALTLLGLSCWFLLETGFVNVW